MNLDNPVPLVRSFSTVPQSDDDSDDRETLVILGCHNSNGWPEIEKGFRSVILAEAGAGKTFEMRARAQFLKEQGYPAFYIQIEDIVENFQQALKVGSPESFHQWLSSQSEAWFFLDSVDEARLTHPRALEKAIRHFATKIKSAQPRAHVCISSRPYAWRPKSDRELIQRHLPFKKPQPEAPGDNSQPTDTSQESENELEIYALDPLNVDDIRLFAEHRAAPEIDRLIEELERSNVFAMAERPYDLEGILDKWSRERALGGRSQLLEHNIELRLKESDPDKTTLRPLTLSKAREGARMLAAAVVLTGEVGIRVPDKTHERTGIHAETVLSHWDQVDIRSLLDSAIFNDVIYGAVRFRHRDVRESLAAEWFAELLHEGHARHKIESQIFREQYGEQIIAPRLRPILPWLILKDENVRRRALALHPHIAIEGGDPARLPLPERKQILVDVVERIVRHQNLGAVQDNSAIARIAQRDLTSATLNLITRHSDHDDAIFFLGRLVWQGNMSDCVRPLLAIVANPTRGVYARIAAARAVSSCGTPSQVSRLWNTLLTAKAKIPRKLLAELLQGTPANASYVAKLLKSIDMLPRYERFKATGLIRALHRFIDRLPIPSSDSTNSLAKLVNGLQEILARAPYIERRACRVSQDFAWLLAPSTHAVERLVSARSNAAMQSNALAIMLNSPAAREWRAEQFDGYKDNLPKLVPLWPELNDSLFWRTVQKERTRLESDGKRLNRVLQVEWLDHYWSYTPDSFARVLDWLNTRKLRDDRLVALSLALRLYAEAEKPAEWLEQLRVAAAGDSMLVARIDEWLNPIVSEEELKWQQRSLERAQKHQQRLQQREQTRLETIARLKASPDLIRNSSKLKPGEISKAQHWLYRQIVGSGLRTTRTEGANWQSLIDQFGTDVAHAYRDAAMAHWRRYKPELPSEGTDTCSVDVSLLFAMAGLDIEAREVETFPAHLTESEVRHTLRYITWELNGFPAWLETMYRTYPQLVMEAVQTELFWELDNATPDHSTNIVLHDLAYYAPWLHGPLISPLMAWLRKHDLQAQNLLRYSLRILKNGGVDPVELGLLAQVKVANQQSADHLPYWYAIWVDADPDTGVVAVADWLARLASTKSSDAAQAFITALMGNRHLDDNGPNLGHFRTPEHLKSLYVLIHKHVRVNEDIDRAGGGVYSPNLRDHAQRARDWLFQLLAEIPGKATHTALRQLIKEHPEKDYRSWMADRAYKRAEDDGDLEPWTARQVHEFSSKLTTTPSTHRQLFDLTVDRLIDLKNWLERGDDSPYVTWQKVQSENEMRVLIAGSLNQHWGNPYTIAQEPELANSQRMDIWLQSHNVKFPVPIELKLLDKNWTGPKLCERMRNQLAGDYMRDGTERCGLMLLVWKGSKSGRRWQISGRRVDISGVEDALKNHWNEISYDFPDIVDLQIIVIDLTTRAIKSGQ